MKKRSKNKNLQMRSAPAVRSHAGIPETRSAIEGLSAQVTTAIEKIQETVKATSEKIDQNVAELTGRIEAVEKRSAKQEEHSPEDRLKELVSGEAAEQIADLGARLEKDYSERMKKLEVAQQRNMVPARDETSAFQRAFAESERFVEWTRRGCPRGEQIEMRVPRPKWQKRVGITLDSDFLADLSRDAYKPEIISLLSDPVGLVDIVNRVAPIAADTYKYLRMTSKSSGGHVATQATSAVDGDPTPKTEVVVDNTEGFVAGQDVVIHTAGGAQTETIVSVDSANSKLVFGTDEIDFDIAAGDSITGTEYLATAEGAEKPAGLIEAEELSVNLQAVATYLILTRQRLANTNTMNLASYVEGLLPERTRENLEWHLLYGSGSSGQLDGFLSHSDLVTDTWSTDLAVGDTRADLLLYSACQIPSNRQMVAVMHKKDWLRISIAKTDDGHYVHNAGAPVRMIDTPALKAIGALRVVLSPKIAESTALVLDVEAASDLVAHELDPVMQWGYINTQFITNQITALYEENLAHAIKDATAFRKAYFDAAPS